jgi:hypothetical protein
MISTSSRFLSAICSALLLTAGPIFADTILPSGAWTIEARDDHERLSIKHERLGTILRDVRLNIQTGKDLKELKQWKVEVTGPKAHTSPPFHPSQVPPMTP